MTASIFQNIDNSWQPHPVHNGCDPNRAELVLCFGSRKLISTAHVYGALQQQFPAAAIVLCSTAGEIFQESVRNDSLVAAALQFDHTTMSQALVNIRDFDHSYDAGLALIGLLPQQDLAYVLVICDGSKVNASELVKGLNDASGKEILITGGLAGDGTDFNTTLIGLNDTASEGNVVAIGFYGKKITVKHGSNGGWQTFGLEKKVTSSQGNKLYELDDKNVLDIYKRYLGPSEADKLPGSSLLFPLSVIMPGNTEPVVRTILAIDHVEKSMTFAGDIPMGSKVRFMKCNLDLLTAAASEAAAHTLIECDDKPAFTLLVSCVGRKIVLDSRTEEEVEAVLDTLGEATPVAGFYSYGEIAPFNKQKDCCLHNQTMTVTSFYESA